jgi:hypothetical protein
MTRLVRAGRLARATRVGTRATIAENNVMCLNCGCLRAHDDIGKHDINIT